MDQFISWLFAAVHDEGYDCGARAVDDYLFGSGQ